MNPMDLGLCEFSGIILCLLIKLQEWSDSCFPGTPILEVETGVDTSPRF